MRNLWLLNSTLIQMQILSPPPENHYSWFGRQFNGRSAGARQTLSWRSCPHVRQSRFDSQTHGLCLTQPRGERPLPASEMGISGKAHGTQLGVGLGRFGTRGQESITNLVYFLQACTPVSDSPTLAFSWKLLRHHLQETNYLQHYCFQRTL